MLLALLGDQIAKALSQNSTALRHSGEGREEPDWLDFPCSPQAAAPTTQSLTASLTLELPDPSRHAVGLAVVASWIPSWYVSRVRAGACAESA